MNKDILTFDEEIFVNSLGVGIESAKQAKEMNLDPRAIRKYVNRLREKGICICSGNEGYWLADSEFEVERTCRRLEAGAKNTLKIAAAIRENYKF